ncbi:MAG TPA: NmrA family NAD(P)-binding protein [Thermoanaerobaculia bacterium]|nr:NmrA family NAD(P)-binding protein [Thermoanaerobaculia bacterium]
MFVVLGASGHTGRAAALALLAQGRKVRVLVRDPKKGQEWKDRGAEVAVADLGDAAAIAKAFEGARGAYLLVPPQYGADDLLAAQKPLVEALAAAVRRSGIPHVVLLSSIGAQHPEGTGPIRTLHAAEGAIRAAAKNLTILRAAYFLENAAPVLDEVRRGVLPTFLTPGRPVPMVATADIGRVAAEALLEAAPGTTILELSGPRDYAPEDLAAALSGKLGREVRVQALPIEAVEPAFVAMGMPAGVARLFREMYAGVNAGLVAWEGPPAHARRGRLGPAEVLGPML